MGNQTKTVVATVEQIITHNSSSKDISGKKYHDEVIYFQSKIIKGDETGKVVTGVQRIDGTYAASNAIKPVEVGKKVILIARSPNNRFYEYMDDYRIDKILSLAGIFFLLLLIVGNKKGFSTIISLAFTFLFIFAVFVPGIMKGFNIYLLLTLTCTYIIVMNLIILNGVGKKTWVTIAGCTSGVIITAIITFVMTHFLQLTGFVDEHAIYLSNLNSEHPIDLVAIIFSAIVLGALGAIMDIAMDLASALYEITQHKADVGFRELFKSGMIIGGDILGTMANTLVLAYIGSSLTSILLLFTYSDSIMHLLNREIIIIELLQALIGSLAILLTVPFTVMLSGMIYLRKA